MSKIRLMALTVAALVMGVGTAHAVDINGKKGLGYAQAIGGAKGLAFDYGTGNLIIEAIIGLKNLSPDQGDGGLTLGLGAGAHYGVLRADEAMVTAGARVNIGMTKEPRIGTDQESITQFNIDVPLRVWYFPSKHFSVHMEWGITILMNPEKGQLWGADSGPKGMDIVVFGDPEDGAAASPFGNVGFTFWW